MSLIIKLSFILSLPVASSFREGLIRANRKRALSPSDPLQYHSPDLDISQIIQQSSPEQQAAASFHLLAAAASSSAALANGSPTSSGSYGNLSLAAANAAATSHHFQQLQAHLMRSSPYLQGMHRNS